MQAPLPSQFMAGKITNDVLDNLHEKSRAALSHEASYYKYFGPLFRGDYANTDEKTLVFAFLQMQAVEIRGQFDVTANDFRQFYAVLAKAEDQVRAQEVRETATCAYKTAEARAQAQIRFISEVAARYGETGFFKDLKDHCRLDWPGAVKFQSEADHLRQGAQAAEGGGADAGETGDIVRADGDGLETAVEHEPADSGPGDAGPE